MRHAFPCYQTRLSLLAKMIGRSVPFLNMVRRARPWPYTLEQMSTLQPGTLGAETAIFLIERDFDLLPQYEAHDIAHTLLRYNTTSSGELRLQAFMWGNRSSSIEGRVLLLIGVALMPELWPTLHTDYNRGRHAAYHLKNWNFANMLDEDIAQLREMLEPG